MLSMGWGEIVSWVAFIKFFRCLSKSEIARDAVDDLPATAKRASSCSLHLRLWHVKV